MRSARERGRRFVPVALFVLALTGASPARAADEQAEAAAARAAVYRLLMKSGYLVNRSATKCYCLAVRRRDDAGAIGLDDPPATAVPSSTTADGRVEVYSRCREACVVLYTADLVWVDDSIATVRGGFLSIYSRHRLRGTPPRPDARLFTVEEQAERGWVVIRSETEPAP